MTLWEILFIASTGCTAAGLTMVLRRKALLGKSLWILPILAAVTFIGGFVVSDYTWFKRMGKVVPAHLVVTMTRNNHDWYRPWIHAKHYIDGFIAIDTSHIERVDGYPNARRVNLYIYQRSLPTSRIPVVYDCAAQTATDWPQKGPLPQSTHWMPMNANEPNMVLACTQPT